MSHTLDIITSHRDEASQRLDHAHHEMGSFIALDEIHRAERLTLLYRCETDVMLWDELLKLLAFQPFTDVQNLPALVAVLRNSWAQVLYESSAMDTTPMGRAIREQQRLAFAAWLGDVRRLLPVPRREGTG